MLLENVWRAMEATGFSATIREAPYAFAAVETLHVIALAVVFGSIAIVDLRLVGVASKNIPVTEMSRELLRWTWAAFGVALVSGGMMFVARASEYMINQQFLAKFAVMALAGVNMAIFHMGVWKGVGGWDLGPTPVAAKTAGLLSLSFWVAIVAFGRWIGYTIGLG
jgi:hypothetical protein